jgi:hypothetical protein
MVCRYNKHDYFQFMLSDCIVKQYPLMFKLGFKLGIEIKEVYLEIRM